MRSLRRVLVVLLAAPWVLWAVARTFGLDDSHPLVAAMSFTTYAAATAILPVLVALVAREWVLAGVATLALLALAVAVVPRALEGPQYAGDGARGPTLVVMTANLHFGQADPDALLRIVREQKVEVLSVQEIGPGDVDELALAGAAELFAGIVTTGDNTALMTRRPLRGVRRPRAGTPEQLRAFVRLPGGGELGLVLVHPLSPLSRQRVRDWQAVLRALPDPDADGRAQVLAGDFNATLDHRDLRRVLDRGYADAADATGDGLRPTFPADRSSPPITIDHVLVAKGIRVRRTTVTDLPGSDHRALIAELVLP